MDEKKTMDTVETVAGEVIDESEKVIGKKKIGKKTLFLGAALAGLAVVTFGLSCLKKDSTDDTDDFNDDFFDEEDTDKDSTDNIED